MAQPVRRPNEPEGGLDLAERREARPKKPVMYRVVLLNDDFTPMEFVVWLLVDVFRLATDAATRLMLEIHTKGRGIAGIYTFDIAQTKSATVQALAAEHGHPLQSVLEPAETE